MAVADARHWLSLMHKSWWPYFAHFAAAPKQAASHVHFAVRMALLLCAWPCCCARGPVAVRVACCCAHGPVAVRVACCCAHGPVAVRVACCCACALALLTVMLLLLVAACVGARL